MGRSESVDELMGEILSNKSFADERCRCQRVYSTVNAAQQFAPENYVLVRMCCDDGGKEGQERRNDQENALNDPVPRENIPIHFGNFNPLNFPLVLNQNRC